MLAVDSQDIGFSIEVTHALAYAIAAVAAICATSQEMATAVEFQSYIVELNNRQIVHIAELCDGVHKARSMAAPNSQRLTAPSESLRLPIGFNR